MVWTRSRSQGVRQPRKGTSRFAELDVEPRSFKTTRIPVLAGRDFLPGEPVENVIVSESFASRHWTVQSAVGQSYRRDPRRLSRHVVGVAGHVRSTDDPPGGRSHRIFQTYVPRQPAPPPQPTTRQPSTGGSFGFVTLLVRVDSRARLADVQQTVQAIDSGFILNAEFVDDIYALQFEDRLLALRVVTAYGSLAFLVAGAGIYGFMAFLVAHRTREIGIRMALGATPGDVRQLIVGLSFKLALAGAVLGVGGAVAASRWMQAQLYAAELTDRNDSHRRGRSLPRRRLQQHGVRRVRPPGWIRPCSCAASNSKALTASAPPPKSHRGR